MLFDALSRSNPDIEHLWPVITYLNDNQDPFGAPNNLRHQIGDEPHDLAPENPSLQTVNVGPPSVIIQDDEDMVEASEGMELRDTTMQILMPETDNVLGVSRGKTSDAMGVMDVKMTEAEVGMTVEDFETFLEESRDLNIRNFPCFFYLHDPLGNKDCKNVKVADMRYAVVFFLLSFLFSCTYSLGMQTACQP